MQPYKNQIATIAAALHRYDEIRWRHIQPTASTAHLQHHAHVYAQLDSLRHLVIDTMTGMPPHRRYSLPSPIVQRYDAVIFDPEQNRREPFHAAAADASRLSHLIDHDRNAIPNDDPNLPGPHLKDFAPAIAHRLRTVLAGLPYDAIPTHLRRLTPENNYPLTHLIARLAPSADTPSLLTR